MKLKHFLLFLVSIIAYSQENTFYHYGLEDGLSQETIITLLKDSDGFLWIGTQDGLNRFDGDSFSIYKNDLEDATSLVDNYITVLLEHNNKNIWIGTATNGVCYYDPKLSVFNSIGSKKSRCSSMVQDENGTIFATYLDDGLSIFSIQNDSILEVDVDYFKPLNLKLSASAIKDQILYIGSNNGRLFTSKLDKENTSFNEIVFDKNIGSINTISIEDSKIWLGTSTGLYIYLTETKQLVTCNIEKFNTNLSEKLTINDIDRSGNIYYISTDNGLFELSDFNTEGLNFESCRFYKGDSNNLNSITSSRVYNVLVDTDKLFIGTNKLDVKPLNDIVFKTINTQSESALNNNHIYSVFKDENYLFVGTRGGLNCIDNQGKVSIITKENTNQKLAYNVIRNIIKDKDNNLWLSTTKGVSIINLNNFNPNKPEIKSIYFDQNNQNSLAFNNTRSTFIDHNNTIWVCTYGGGLSRFIGDIKSNTFSFKNYKHDANKNSLSSDFVFSITQDKDHNYWVSTDNGLNKIHFTNNDYNLPVYTNYYRDSESPNSLNNNTILSTFHDKDNTLWIASQDGLHKFNNASNTFKHYGKNEGLTNTFVYGILEDDYNNLWMTTNSGIFKFNKTTEVFTNYNTKDGVQSSEFNLGPKFKDPKTNTFYFGGINGFNYFNPKEVDKLDVEGQLIFTSLKIKGKEINPVKHPETISKNIIKANEINLNYDEFPSTISFSELDFRKTKNNQFVYKLLPNNENWNELNDTKGIQLLDLPKGDYTLLVQGKTRNKLWQTKPLEIKLNILPPWYKSNLAYALYTFFGLGLFFLFYKFQIQKKLAHQETNRLRELNDLRNKLYTNITHEFRTPITVISGMAQNLKEKLNKTNTPEIDNSLEMIERNSNNLLNLVNQMLDLAKLEKGKLGLNLKQDDIVWHTRYLTESFLSYAQEKGIALVFYNEDEEIIMDYDADKITQIISNLVSNAIKFCEEKSKIIVHISKVKKNNELLLKIKDTGKGIPDKNLPFIFDRFYQVEHSENEGSGIGLALTKELVGLMQGEIHVESKLNFGTTFTINLPITNTAETSKIAIKKPIVKPEQKTVVNNVDRNSDKPIALVAEDNPDVASYINICLEDSFQILNAINGEEGIQLAIEHTPDIIISDVMMPKKNGFELCETLKQDIKTNHIPIILLTAKASQQDKISGLTIGADAYLTKPFNKDELLIRTTQLIELRKTLQSKYKLDSNFNIAPQKTPENVNDAFINNVIEAINKNIEDSNFNAFYLARALHLSESQLYRKLKALTNTSTAIYIRKIRLLKAKQLLQTTDLTVSETAYATGFNDPSWFSKAFKEEFDLSPSDTRN